MIYKKLIKQEEKALKLTNEIMKIQKKLIKSLKKQIKINTLIEANKKRGVNPHIKTELKGGLN